MPESLWGSGPGVQRGTFRGNPRPKLVPSKTWIAQCGQRACIAASHAKSCPLPTLSTKHGSPFGGSRSTHTHLPPSPEPPSRCGRAQPIECCFAHRTSSPGVMDRYGARPPAGLGALTTSRLLDGSGSSAWLDGSPITRLAASLDAASATRHREASGSDCGCFRSCRLLWCSCGSALVLVGSERPALQAFGWRLQQLGMALHG